MSAKCSDICLVADFQFRYNNRQKRDIFGKRNKGLLIVKQQDWGLAAILIAMALGGTIVWSLLNVQIDYLIIAVILLIGSIVALAANLWSCRKNTERPEPYWYSSGKDQNPDTAPLVDALVNESRANREYQQRKENLRYPIERFTLFAVVVTAGFVIFQWREMRLVYEPIKDQASIAERALISGRRAFISVTFSQTANLNITTGNITHWSFTPIWVNAGDTPTRNMENHINMQLFETEMPFDWDFSDMWDASVAADQRLPVPLGASPRNTVNGQTVSTTVEALIEIVNNKKFLYMWGWAAYNDVFPDTMRHITRFAVRVASSGDPHIRDRITFSYPLLRRYNCSDEECKRQGYPADWMPREIK